MNLEERIIELLAEYLKKGEQRSDRADQTDRSIEIMSRALAANDLKFNAMNEAFIQERKASDEKFYASDEKFKSMNEALIQEIKSNSEQFNAMNEEFKSMNEAFIKESKSNNEKFNAWNEKSDLVTREIKELRTDQAIMLKELVSLSKRTAVLEEKSWGSCRNVDKQIFAPSCYGWAIKKAPII